MRKSSFNIGYQDLNSKKIILQRYLVEKIYGVLKQIYRLLNSCIHISQTRQFLHRFFQNYAQKANISVQQYGDMAYGFSTTKMLYNLKGTFLSK